MIQLSLDAPTQYKMMAENPMRTITRLSFSDLIIHTDWDPLTLKYIQRTMANGKENITSIFKFKRYG
jgi:hypothetical protein